MAVRVEDRSETKLEVLNATRDMAAHVMKMAGQETLIPKRHRWFLGKEIVDDAVNIYKLCVMANNTYVDSRESAIRRITYYKLAYENCAGLLSVLQVGELAIDSLHGHRTEVIVRMICRCEAEIAKTINREKNRYFNGK